MHVSSLILIFTMIFIVQISHEMSYVLHRPIAGGYVYFNCASEGLMSRAAYDAAVAYLGRILEKGDRDLETYFSTVDNARKLSAKIINAPEESVGLIRNTTEGVQIIKNSYPEIKNIIIYGKSFPCTEIPFTSDKRYSVDVMSQSPEKLEKDLKEYGRSIIFTDLVNFLTGEISDVNAIVDIASQNDSIVAVDAIQACGYLPINAETMKPDFLFTGTSKWLLGPQGCGFMYMDKKHLKRITSKCSGWLSLNYTDFGSFEHLPEPRNDASVIEAGTRNYLGIIIMEKNLQFLAQTGIEHIYRHNMEGIRIIIRQLELMGSVTQDSSNVKTPLVSLKCRNTRQLYDYLSSHDVTVSFRDNHVRFAYHIFNTEAEAEALVDILKGYRL